MMPSKFYIHIAIFFLLSFSPSCVQNRLENRLAGHSAQQRVTLKSLHSAHSNKDREELSWVEATKMLEQQNLTLRRAREQVAYAKKQRKDQWLSLIPKINGFVGLSQSFSDLASLSSDDIDARVLASFNLPNPIRFYGQSYALALQELQAEWSYELTRRQLYIQLYTMFIEENLLSRRLQKSLRDERSRSQGSVEGLTANLVSSAQERRVVERAWSYHRIALNRLLNTPGRHWRPTGKTPTVSYKSKYKDLHLGEKFGKLALKLQTLQIESAALSIMNVKLRQLPSLSQGITSPVLFSSDEGSRSELSADNFFLFAGVSKVFDLTDIAGKKDLRKAQVRAEYTRDQLKLTMASEIQRLDLLKKSYSRLLAEQSKLEKSMVALRKKKSGGAFETIFDEYKKYRDLDEENISLDTQIARMDIQFWLWDDVYWKKN